MSSPLDQPVRGFLDDLAARTAAPGGGGAAAVTGALAAGLVAMAARFSVGRLPGAGDLAEAADELRRRAADLVDLDARAYQAVLDLRTRETLHGAAVVPLEIAEIGARVAAMAVRVAEDGNPNLRGDAMTGAVLAAASARSAAALVDINVRLGKLEPELSRRAAQAVADAGDAAERVMTGAPGKESALRAAGNTIASAVRALVVPSGGRLTQSVAGWLARSARRQPVRSSACLDAKLPGIRGDRRVAEAVVGVTVRAGGGACAAGPAGSAALLR